MSGLESERIHDRLRQLEELRYSFAPGDAVRVAKLLVWLGAQCFPDAASLVRFHEALLALRAFPHAAAIVRKTEGLLRGFSKRVEQLEPAGADFDAFDAMEVSGIAGTTMQAELSFDVARWLVGRMPRVAEIAWDDYADERGLYSVWPKLIPLQEEDACVEANIPWRKWLQAARPSGKTELQWLVERVQSLPGSALEKSRIYDSLRLPVRWTLGNRRCSRTLHWKTPRHFFYRRQPLIARSQVLLKEQLAQRPPVLRRLSPVEGAAAMNFVREVMLVRYRELYGTTLGDPRSVVRADVGRGVSIYLWNLPPERRLPLRAYVAGLTLKNGVPVNYIEAIGLFEWMEVGFNTFYTYRGGEVAWIFAQVLRCLHRRTGATCISMYPYQLGDRNEEAIDSGAYWFYRKLGFRPASRELTGLLEREERRIAIDGKYRTGARMLRRLASAPLLYELPGADAGAWDTFSVRNIGLKVNRHMAQQFQSDDTRLPDYAAFAPARDLGVDPKRWKALESKTFGNFARVLSCVPGMTEWSVSEKRALGRLIRAKTAPDEMHYLRLSQKHGRLREAFLELGS